MNDREFLSEDEQRRADDPNVGSGNRETAPHEPVAPVLKWWQREPVRVFAGGVFAAAQAAAIDAFSSGQPIRGVLLAVGGAALIATGEQIRKLLTPIADPHLDGDTPLVVGEEPA